MNAFYRPYELLKGAVIVITRTGHLALYGYRTIHWVHQQRKEGKSPQVKKLCRPTGNMSIWLSFLKCEVFMLTKTRWSRNTRCSPTTVFTGVYRPGLECSNTASQNKPLWWLTIKEIATQCVSVFCRQDTAATQQGSVCLPGWTSNGVSVSDNRSWSSRDGIKSAGATASYHLWHKADSFPFQYSFHIMQPSADIMFKFTQAAISAQWRGSFSWRQTLNLRLSVNDMTTQAWSEQQCCCETPRLSWSLWFVISGVYNQ